MTRLLDFLNANSGAVSAVATSIAALVAAVYTFYTTKLWRVSQQQVQIANVQAKLMERQLSLVELQMNESKRSFEATNRPRLIIDGLPDLAVHASN